MASKIKIHFENYFMETNLPVSFDEFISMCYEFDNFDFNEYTFIFSNFLIKFYFDNVNEYQKVLSELTRRNYGSKITIVKRNQNEKSNLQDLDSFAVSAHWRQRLRRRLWQQRLRPLSLVKQFAEHQ